MGIINITKTYPDGTIETQEVDTDVEEKVDNATKYKNKKSRKLSKKPDEELPQD